MLVFAPSIERGCRAVWREAFDIHMLNELLRAIAQRLSLR